MAKGKAERELVLEALKKRALGFDVVEERESVEEDDTGKRKVKTQTIKKAVPPDVGAVKLWLSREAAGDAAVTLVSRVPRPAKKEKKMKTPNAKGEARED